MPVRRARLQILSSVTKRHSQAICQALVDAFTCHGQKLSPEFFSMTLAFTPTTL
jgi:hypothetical protein